MGNNQFLSNVNFKGKEYDIFKQNKVKNIQCIQNTNEANIQNIQIIDNPKWNLLNSKFLQSNHYCPNNLQTISLRTYDQLQSRKSYLFKIQSILLDGQFDMIPNIQTHKTVVQSDKNKQNQKNHQNQNINKKNQKKSKKNYQQRNKIKIKLFIIIQKLILNHLFPQKN